MKKEIISTTDAPTAIGPYSQAIKSNNLLFISGQIPVDPATNEISTKIEDQAHQVMKNIHSILKAAGLSFDNVVKSTIFLTDLNNFTIVNDIYASYFTGSFPARECVQVAALPKNVSIEISVIVAE